MRATHEIGYWPEGSHYDNFRITDHREQLTALCYLVTFKDRNDPSARLVRVIPDNMHPGMLVVKLKYDPANGLHNTILKSLRNRAIRVLSEFDPGINVEAAVRQIDETWRNFHKYE